MAECAGRCSVEANKVRREFFGMDFSASRTESFPRNGLWIFSGEFSSPRIWNRRNKLAIC